MTSADGAIILEIEDDRVQRVLVKLARGHAMFELATSLFQEPTTVGFLPLHLMTPEDRGRFEKPIQSDLWPEVGSRKLLVVATHGEPHNDWMVVQNGLYRYLAAVTRSGVVVRMVLSEYLAAEVQWD